MFLNRHIAPPHERQLRRSILSGATQHAADTCRFGFIGQGQLMSAQGHRFVGAAQPVGWDQRRFAAPAHHDFSMFPEWWAGARSELVPPYVKKAMALMSANKPEERALTEVEKITAMEQALAIKPPSDESSDSVESGSASPLFQLGLIVAVVFPLAWGIGAARLKSSTTVPVAAAAVELNESETEKSKPTISQFRGDRNLGDELFLAGNFESALHHYRSLGSAEILRLPKELLFRIALCQEGLGLWDEALAGQRSVAAVDDQPLLSAAATLGQARIWLRLHQPDRAVPLLRSLALRPALAATIRRELAFLGPIALSLEMSDTRESNTAERHGVGEGHAGNEQHAETARQSLNDFNPVADVLTWPLMSVLDDIEILKHTTFSEHRPASSHDSDTPHADRAAASALKPTNVTAATVHCTPVCSEDSVPLQLEERLVTAASSGCSLGAMLEVVAQQCGMTLEWRDDSRELAFAHEANITVDELPVCSLLTAICDALHVVWFSKDSTLTIAQPDEGGQRLRTMTARTLVSLATLIPEHRLASHARFAAGRLWRVDGHFGEAARLYSSLVGPSITPLAMRAAFNAGECYYRMGDLRRAGDQLELIVHGAPGHELHTRAAIWRGRCLLDRGEFREAAFQFLRATGGRIPPEDQAYASVFLAMAHLMQDQPQAAANALFFEKGQFESPAVRNAAALLTAFTRFSQLAGEPQQREAAFLYRALVAIESDTEWLGPTGQLLVGRALREAGVGERAIPLYERELERNPPPAIAHEMKFAIAEQRQRDQQLLEAKAGWQELATSGAGVWKNKAQLKLAELSFREGAWDECLAACRTLHESAGVSRKETLQLMGRVYERLNKDRLAAECYAGRLPPAVMR